MAALASLALAYCVVKEGIEVIQEARGMEVDCECVRHDDWDKCQFDAKRKNRGPVLQSSMLPEDMRGSSPCIYIF